ncbi:hypothetical protein PVAND_011255 [Polypedilum vanderplanki]|uniref:Uncharacterized protein n=1 Tax=Polypedilum vanderplanki TaxID=319348 RepID=A0A9J6CIZ7_POLVA|nr:hypothetical protein PVAND_011255 [Polypedilum vanderplanki]
MSYKLIIFCASMAISTCAFIDLNEQIENQMQYQQEMRQLQNEQIREHQELQHQQRQDQLQQLIDSRRVQEQFIRDQEQERLDRMNEGHHHLNNNPHHQHHNVFWPHNHHNTPAVIHLQPAIINIPSSSRHINTNDDSNYNFGYTVSDITTGYFKSHEESKAGDQVHGKYTMLDSDGFQRTVNYRANDVHGFNADVRRDPAAPSLIFINNNHGHSQQRHQFSRTPNTVFFTTTHPRSTSIAQVSRIEDGAQSNYVTATTSF